MPELTKDAEKLICCIYKEYLEKHKSGIPKSKAKRFGINFYQDIKSLSKWSSEDISDTLQELHQNGYIKQDISGGFFLLDSAVVYMENRFKKGLEEITDFISKFIP